MISFGFQEERLQLDCMQNLSQNCTSENKSHIKFTEKEDVKIVQLQVILLLSFLPLWSLGYKLSIGENLKLASFFKIAYLQISKQNANGDQHV